MSGAPMLNGAPGQTCPEPVSFQSATSAPARQCRYVTSVAVRPALPVPAAPVIGLARGARLVEHPSALTHWAMPDGTENRSFGFLFFTPFHFAIGSSTLWNSKRGDRS